MNKDAFYFPHFSNARNDRKLRRVRKELGIEGYGIYYMVLETLRDQDGFKYPLEDIDLLAEEFNTSEQKLRAVVCNYTLFDIDDEQNFFSARFNEYLKPYLDNKERNRISGIKGNLIRHKYITKEEANTFTDEQIIAINEDVKGGNRLAVGGRVATEQGSDRKESKVKKSKEKKIYKGIEERYQDFKNKVWNEFQSKYSLETLKAFCEYWGEYGDADKKMRYEKQDSFSISRRLSTWKKNENKFNPQATPKQHQHTTQRGKFNDVTFGDK